MDLTKYIEKHEFTLDNVFEKDATNQLVRNLVYTTFRFMKSAFNHL